MFVWKYCYGQSGPLRSGRDYPRDSVGSTILAFLGPLGACFINEADLEALRISLREACRSAYLWKRGIRHVQLGEPSVCVQLLGKQQTWLRRFWI